jgi:hypothetical protein
MLLRPVLIQSCASRGCEFDDELPMKFFGGMEVELFRATARTFDDNTRYIGSITDAYDAF